MTRPRLSLRHDRRGVSVVEFAFIAPAFCLILVGLFDIGHTLYMRAALQGVMQKAARDSTLETNTTTARLALIDAKIERDVKVLAPAADVDFSRRYYRTFSDAAAAQREDFTDDNGNGRCDAGEPFEDANHNGVWDADGGNEGQGGAKDATVLTVTVTYPPMFPLRRMLGQANSDVKLTAKTVLKNQPYSDQGSYAAPTEGHCP